MDLLEYQGKQLFAQHGVPVPSGKHAKTIEDAEFETVGGLIFAALGSVPQPGQAVESHGLRFTVETVADRRIQAVRVERVSPGEPAG